MYIHTGFFMSFAFPFCKSFMSFAFPFCKSLESFLGIRMMKLFSICISKGIQMIGANVHDHACVS